MLLLLACAEDPDVWTARALGWASYPRVDTDDDYEPIVGAPGDYTGDGELDLLVFIGEGREERETYLIPGPFDGDMTGSQLTLSTTGLYVGAPGDVTGDGIADLLVQARGDANVHLSPGPFSGSLDGKAGEVMEGTGDAMFAAPTTCDVDGDGVAELLAIGESKGRIYDQAGGVLVTMDASYSGNAPVVECLGDIDDDGLNEVRFGPRVWLDPIGAPAAYLDLGTNSWTGAVSWRAGDLDGDGTADLLVPGDGTLGLVPGPVSSLTPTLSIESSDGCWGHTTAIVGPVDLNDDLLGDLLVARSSAGQGCSWDGPGRIDGVYGAITGPIGDGDLVLEGGDIKESCHEEQTINGPKTVCDQLTADLTGKSIGSGYSSVGVLPDLTGDGKPELWVVTLSDWMERTVWVVRGG